MPHDPSLMLYISIIPNYTAPDDVYRSARTMGSNRTNNGLSNLTWGLPVDKGFNYLVRLHFCEIDPNIHFIGERMFNIYIDSLIADLSADVIWWTSENGKPIYKDYAVQIQKKGVEDNGHILSIDLHPDIRSSYLNAILNSVEVFKLSNADGNLAKHGAAEVLLNIPLPMMSTKKFTAIIISAVGFLVVLFLLGCMFFWKIRMNKRHVSYYAQSRCWCWFKLNPYKGKQTGKKTFSLRKEQCHHFSLADIKIATNNFHEDLIIGVGGFGNVYKGQIDDDETITVAIKRLNPESRQGAHEFRTEIEMLSQLR